MKSRREGESTNKQDARVRVRVRLRSRTKRQREGRKEGRMERRKEGRKDEGVRAAKKNGKVGKWEKAVF